MKKVIKFIIKIPSYIASGFVLLYKYAISPLLPHTCKFTPSCSFYGFLAIKRFGFFKGTFMAIKRVFRCNPFSVGGEDYVPYNLKGDFKCLI
ncbi:MAG: membrane protein insertion efficiency factor YidD [Clostridia bacterium]|nr:membrane protein insertion efficiency factor YidD [Clostridia bacterium]